MRISPLRACPPSPFGEVRPVPNGPRGLDQDLQDEVQACPEAVVEAACRQARELGDLAAARGLLDPLGESLRAARLDERLSARIEETLTRLGSR